MSNGCEHEPDRGARGESSRPGEQTAGAPDPPPAAYPQDNHCECLHKALSGAQCGNWSLVIDELDHDG